MSVDFDLTDIRVFLAVVERGSLSGGAQACSLALASVSERVSGMEAALGSRLLERTRRGVRTTAAGDALLPHARRILGQVETMCAEMRAYATGLKGRIRLLSNTAALATFLPQQVCQFLVANPDLSVDLDEQPSSEIVLAIAAGRADLGVVADIADLTALQRRLIAQDHLVVLASNTHRLGREQAVAFASVVGEPFVGLSDAALEVHLGERASLLGRQINYRAQVRSVEDVAMLVAAGVGVSIMPEISAAKILRPGLVIVRLSEPWATRELYLCARDFSALTPQAALLARQLMARQLGVL